MEERDIVIGNKSYKLSSDGEHISAIGNIYEPEMCKLFSCVVQPHHSVLDIGANIGCTTILFGQIAKDVTAFEPSPTTYGYLTKNIDASGLTNAQALNFALGDEEFETTLTYWPTDRGGAFLSDKTKASEGHIVEPVSVKIGDKLLDGRPIDFIKIDTEGFELHVLRGLQKTIETSRPILVTEMNHWCLNAFQRVSIPEFIDYLSDTFPIVYAVNGMKYLDLHNHHQRYVAMHRHIMQFQYPNVLAAFDPDQVASFLENYTNG